MDINANAHDPALLTQAQAIRQQQILYRVKRGETLSKIARIHNVTVADIKGWNKGLGNTVRVGQKIKLIVDVDQI